MRTSQWVAICGVVMIGFCQCSKSGSSGSSRTGTDTTGANTTTSSDVAEWLTTSDQAFLLKKMTAALDFQQASGASNATIAVDSTTAYQGIDGFGFTLTGGSAYVLYSMSSAARSGLLKELFGSDSTSIGISYLRLSIGASDLSASVFSYDDVTGDTVLASFNLGVDSVYLIPLLKEILAVNPSIRIIATPWSAPVWMKDNGSSVGGSLQTKYYGVYAQYLVKYIQAMKAQGIGITAVTPQNEPLNPDNNPSMSMTAAQEADFVGNYLGPAFTAAGVSAKIVVYDHNCDNTSYAASIFADAVAGPYADGAAFHLYAGSISALSTVHNAYPSKNLYFTEQYTASTGSFSGDLEWHVENVIIGSMNNWSRIALEWNLATNSSYGPYTSGGCSTCQGALTVTGSTAVRNVSYYIVAHAAKFVPAGSVRISSSTVTGLPNVAFLTPSGKKVLIVTNNSGSTQVFNIKYKGSWVTTSLAASGAATYVW